MSELAQQNTGVGERQTRLLIIVDDQAMHLFYTSILLQRLGYHISATKSAEDALEIMNATKPALVLTEIAMASINGVELLKKIKRNPRTYKVPVIILTSSKDQVIKSTCLEEGCAAYIQKPVDADVLYAAIQKATEKTPRRFIRLQTRLNVMVGNGKTAENSVIKDYITALSEQGMFVSTSNPKPIGIQIPITIFFEDSMIKVEGMVIYSFKREDGPLKTPGMGIKIVHIKPDDQRMIKTIITKEITKGLTMGQMGGTIF
jgi:CheY-like chemotaxis protein